MPIITRKQDGTEELTFVGMVLQVHGYVYMGNDCEKAFATVWLEAEGRPKRVGYSSLHYDYGQDRNSAVIDASPEIKTLFNNWCAAEEARHDAEEAARREREFGRGKKVVVARGRKVPKGTIGEIFWIGDNGYGESLGLFLADGTKVFTASKNCDIILKNGVAERAEGAASTETVKAEFAKGVGVELNGEQGTIFWIGQAKNGSGVRVGVEFADGDRRFYAQEQVAIPGAQVQKSLEASTQAHL